MHTWGFASSKFPRGAKNRVNDYIAYSTSLAYLPVDWVPFYLSPVEYNNLPIGSYIKEVYVEVIPKGVRCSFDVGTTLTGSANSMHVIFGKHCIGLNQKFDITNMSLKPNDKSPMTISEIGDISNLNEHINIPIIKYSYKPRNGILKHPYHNAVVPNKVKAFINHTDVGKKTCQYIQEEAFAQNTPSVYPLFEQKGQKLAYENIIDK
ncbi:Capsid protein VP4 [Popillia japonica]|uniref:Capsid protein VP4 n=1 Tax=Popillia japonica TaxID=7064 RepID=A0AAW1KMA0_POPJA